MKLKIFKSTMLFLTLFLFSTSIAEEVRKINFAVLGLKNGTGVNKGETDILADRLRVNLFRTGRVNMMERSQMDEILKEQGFQASGACNDAECAVEMGQMLGVERVVGGSIGKLGSLFLVNLRVIDVQTAKIIKVVSKDISGGIEGVVKFLPDLAEELVKDPKGEGAPVTLKPVVPEENDQQVAEKKTPKVNIIIEEEKSDFSAEKPGKKVSGGKNKNRGGIRISAALFPGIAETYFSDSDIESQYEEVDWLNQKYADNTMANGQATSVTAKETNVNANLTFIIPIGKLITADVGPGFGFLSRKVEIDYNFWDVDENDYVMADGKNRLQILSPKVSLGINLVKRFSPIKINAGFTVDFNFNLIKYTESLDLSEYYTYYSNIDEVDRAFAFSTSFGPKVGIEFLAGKKVGFSIDYMFKFNKIKTSELDTGDYEFESYLNGEYWKFLMPKNAIVFGISIYR